MILLAVCGFLFAWQESVQQRLRNLRGLCTFYHRAHYAFETQKMHCIAFFETCPVSSPVFQETLNLLCVLLETCA